MPAPDIRQISTLVNDVAASLEVAFGPLRKADGDPPPDDDAGSPPAAASAAPPSPADSPDPAASPDAPPSADPAAAAGGGDPAADAGQGVTVESLMSEYAALPLPMLQMHLQAAEAAFQQVAGGAGGDPSAAGGAPPPPPGAGSPPPPAASASPGGPPPGMGKSEIVLPADIMSTIAGLQKSVEQIGGLRKSLVDVNAKLVARDGELQATKSALAKAQDDMAKMTADTDKVAKGVSAILARPGVLRKSASRMSDVAVSGKPGAQLETATIAGIAAETPRAVVIQHLNKFTREGHSLTKADSQKLTTYICNSQAPVQPVLEILAKFPTQ